MIKLDMRFWHSAAEFIGKKIDLPVSDCASETCSQVSAGCAAKILAEQSVRQAQLALINNHLPG